jgi:hypothetical protein
MDDKISGKSLFALELDKVTKEKQIADLIFLAIHNWDYNIYTKSFANKLAKEIRRKIGDFS